VRDFVVKRIQEWEERSGKKATRQYGRKFDDIHQEVADELNSLRFPLPEYLKKRKNFLEYNSRFVANLYYEETRQYIPISYDKELREEARKRED
jgi:hypothetical protein